ncbi:ribonuclease R [Mycoplasma anserisalpingitidis]|uniref:Ribonuclease R n=1 Tax=Mycoplasma anserisalpingitidis TaxID=519450 RepID=A0A5B8K2B8_9MOLU|nr:ribonuclease R [Mycoplasma anserisalpingitidis]QDY87005.1 ribonuclease R [Mycoplasma anserisalpingitidis]
MDKKNIKTEIFDVINKFGPINFVQLVRKLKLLPNENKNVSISLIELENEHKVFKNWDGEYYSPILHDEFDGVLKINNSGKFGFVTELNENELIPVEELRDCFVAKYFFNTALHDDFVHVKVFYEDKTKEKTFGVITKIIERKTTELIGFLVSKNSFVDFKPLDNKYNNAKYRINDLKVNAKINDLVVARVSRIQNEFIYVTIEEIITNKTDPKVFFKAFLEKVKVPKEFNSNMTPELKEIPQTIENENLDGRVDLRNELIVTIDGDDTKDFDDAINVKKLENGNFLLGVHIADVSYYVTENSEIDKEALKRGTSIYLADRVIPMLPFELSNGICSLNPHEDRFAISALMEIDDKGNNIKTEIFPSIIQSKYRLTYKQVNKFLDQQDLLNNDQELTDMINLSYELSKILHEYKTNQGYIDFEIDEPKIYLNEDGTVKDIIVAERGVSEVLIEDFMVRANEQVAEFLTKRKLPVMYRVHDAPDDEKLTNLENVLSVLDIPFKKPQGILDPIKFAQIATEIKEYKYDEFIKLLFLRTMQKAKYTSINIGHFGLASKFYCHFTSPIRRYPDLMIHRILRELVFNKNTEKLSHFNEIIEGIANQNSSMEQSSVDIERNSNDLFYAEYFKNKIGQKFHAQIISVTKFGMFIEFPNKTDALIHKSTLLDGEYEANETMTVIGSSNRKFKIGQFVDVIVTGVDLVEGKVDAVLEEFYAEFLNNEKNKKNFRSVKSEQIRKN